MTCRPTHGLEEPPHVAKRSTVAAHPRIRHAGSEAEPCRIGPSNASVLPHVSDHMLEQHRLWKQPGMGIERRDAQVKEVVVLLIPDLLELVDPGLPERRDLDFHAMAMYHAVSVAAAASCDVETFRCAPPGYDLFADRSSLTRGPRSNPIERAPLSGVIAIRYVVILQRRRDRHKETNVRVLDRGCRHGPTGRLCSEKRWCFIGWKLREKRVSRLVHVSDSY